MTEETRKKIDEEYEDIRKSLRKPVSDIQLAYTQGRLTSILFVYGLLEEEEKENGRENT